MAASSTEGRRTSRRGLRRAIGLLAFLPVASRAPAYTRLLWALVRDERTPNARKGYLVVGRDIVPDDVPILGGLDDLVVVVLAVDLFLDGVPIDILHEHLDELGIERAEFDRDIAQVRRLMPMPVRRLVRRIPGAIAAAGRSLESSGVAPRLREWINREVSPA
ncbi:MAG: hypothetical protein FJ038_08150 [Chloroflexi bacterium]|nr:hypothetical protein [Chloroflexota bacterium]